MNKQLIKNITYKSELVYCLISYIFAKMHLSRPKKKILRQKEIGEGGFASAHQLVTEKGSVIIKQMPCENFDPSVQVDISCESEVNFMKKFSHSWHFPAFLGKMYKKNSSGEMCLNILQEFGGYEVDKIRLSEENCWEFIAQMALALLELQNQNVLHKDIKTNNIVSRKLKYTVNGEQRFFLLHKLIDFGAAQEINPKMGLYGEQGVGTRRFEATEVTISSRRQSFPVDVYSLGITLFCLTNKEEYNEDPYFFLDELIDQLIVLSEIELDPTEKFYEQLIEELRVQLYMYYFTCGKKFHSKNQYKSSSLDSLIEWMLHSNPQARPTPLEILRFPQVFEGLNRLYSKVTDYLTQNNPKYYSSKLLNNSGIGEAYMRYQEKRKDDRPLHHKIPNFDEDPYEDAEQANQFLESFYENRYQKKQMDEGNFNLKKIAKCVESIEVRDKEEQNKSHIDDLSNFDVSEENLFFQVPPIQYPVIHEENQIFSQKKVKENESEVPKIGQAGDQKASKFDKNFIVNAQECKEQKMGFADNLELKQAKIKTENDMISEKKEGKESQTLEVIEANEINVIEDLVEPYESPRIIHNEQILSLEKFQKESPERTKAEPVEQVESVELVKNEGDPENSSSKVQSETINKQEEEEKPQKQNKDALIMPQILVPVKNKEKQKSEKKPLSNRELRRLKAINKKKKHEQKIDERDEFSEEEEVQNKEHEEHEEEVCEQMNEKNEKLKQQILAGEEDEQDMRRNEIDKKGDGWKRFMKNKEAEKKKKKNRK